MRNALSFKQLLRRGRCKYRINTLHSSTRKGIAQTGSHILAYNNPIT